MAKQTRNIAIERSVKPGRSAHFIRQTEESAWATELHHRRKPFHRHCGSFRGDNKDVQHRLEGRSRTLSSVGRSSGSRQRGQRAFDVRSRCYTFKRPERIQGTYIRQPVFLDGKGKNVQPPPFMRLDMAKSERPVELYRPFTISAMEPLLMLEFDEVLGTCFSASSGKSAQQPTRLAASQDLRTWNRRDTRWSM